MVLLNKISVYFVKILCKMKFGSHLYGTNSEFSDTDYKGSGSELVLCEKLNRQFVSAELHLDYFKMITNRLSNNGDIAEEFKLDCVKNKTKYDKLL